MSYCCAADTNGCLHSRCRAFVLSGQVSAEWSRCLGSIGRRARDSVVVWFFATKFSRLDAWENRKVVRWSRTKTSSHNSKDALDGRLSEAGKHCGTREGLSSLLLNGPGLRWLFTSLLVQDPSQSQQAASRVKTHDVYFLAKWLEVSAVRVCPVQRYSEVCGSVA